jgi:hypothetical protein
MSVNGVVRCRCFEEGKLKPGPIPYEDLYINCEQCLASKTLDEAYERLGFRRYKARYGKLDWEFDKWKDHCCEHEDCDYIDVSNWTGWGEFCDFVEEQGGKDKFPQLTIYLTEPSCRTYSAEESAVLLKELNELIDLAKDPEAYAISCPAAVNTKKLLEASIETGNPIWWC